MSDSIKDKMARGKSNSKDFELSNADFAYLVSADRIRSSYQHYMQGLMSEFMKIKAVNDFGYKAEDDLQFSIDLADESHILTVTKLPKPKKSIDK